MTITDAQRDKIVKLLGLNPKSMTGGANVVAETLTDSHGCNQLLGELAGLIASGIEDDSDKMDKHIGRVVRQAVEAYALSCIKEG